MTFLRTACHATPVLFAAAIGFRLECVMIDVLHTVGQGVASHVVGNVLWVFVIIRGWYGGNMQAGKLAKLRGQLKSCYTKTKCASRVRGKLPLESLRQSGAWPKLRAKAAVTRRLAQFALEMVVTHGTGETDDGFMQALCQLQILRHLRKRLACLNRGSPPRDAGIRQPLLVLCINSSRRVHCAPV